MKKIKKCSHCETTEGRIDLISVYGDYLCVKHAKQFVRHGKFFERTIYDEQNYKLSECGKYYYIILRNKNCEVTGKAIIDFEDYEKCKEHKWYLDNYGYVKRSRDDYRLHHFLLDLFLI